MFSFFGNKMIFTIEKYMYSFMFVLCTIFCQKGPILVVFVVAAVQKSQWQFKVKNI